MRTVLRLTWQGLADLRAQAGFKHPFMPPQTYCSRQLHHQAFARTCQQQQRAGTWPQMRTQVQADATQRDPARQSKRSHSGATNVPDQPAQLAHAAEPASPGLLTPATDTAGGDSAPEQQTEQHAAAIAQAGAAGAGSDAAELLEKRGSASGKQRRARRYYYTGTIGETHLTCVAGVGPKNEQLLRGKGLDSVQVSAGLYSQWARHTSDPLLSSSISLWGRCGRCLGPAWADAWATRHPLPLSAPVPFCQIACSACAAMR